MLFTDGNKVTTGVCSLAGFSCIHSLSVGGGGGWVRARFPQQQQRRLARRASLVPLLIRLVQISQSDITLNDNEAI